MAGRIRTIKPEILENRRTATLSANAFRLFIGCILQADDYGNFYAAPGKLQGAIFWGCSPAEPIADLLAELSRGSREHPEKPPLLSLYTVGGEPYGHLTGWDEHQKVDKPSRPRVPGPEKADASKIIQLRETRETLATPSRDSPETLGNDLDLRSGSPISDPDRVPRAPARDPAALSPASPPDPPPALASRDWRRGLEQRWIAAIGVAEINPPGLSELADQCDIAAPALSLAPAALFDRAVVEYRAYRETCSRGRVPALTPRKIREHWVTVVERITGTAPTGTATPAKSSRIQGPAEVSDFSHLPEST